MTMILGEKWDDYLGFECDDYDVYDPFAEESDTDQKGDADD